MPCYSPPGAYGLECHDEKGDCTKRIKAEIDQLTRMLCEACEILREADQALEMAMSQELRKWWRMHREWDRKRGKHAKV